MFFNKRKIKFSSVPSRKYYVENEKKEKIESVFSNLKNNNCKNLIKIDKKISFLVGAGISTETGIPDFRSEEGKYNQIANKYNLEDPKKLFDIKFFRNNPYSFNEYSKELIEYSNYKPSKAHVTIL